MTFLPYYAVFLLCSILPGSFGFSLNCYPTKTQLSNTWSVLYSIKGDPLRDATGIRPSLHPTTINTIAEVLKLRATNEEGKNFKPSDTVTPLDIAVLASQIATEAVLKRQQSSEEDGMMLTAQEEQAIAGRIVGVIMRFEDLESKLQEKVSKVGWISKYNEWATFGVLENNEGVDDRIKEDPLFAISRAECLLALFLNDVEIPQLKKAEQSMPDESKIDFLDADRLEVLLPDSQ